MKNTISYSALIRAIEKIYLRLSLVILHKRMSRHHARASHSVKPYATDIRAPLSECINGIVDTAPDDPADLETINYAALTTSKASVHIPEKHNTAERHVISKLNVGELSRYFKSRNKAQVLHPGMEERLEHSTWEHIHAAVRYAKRGDDAKAKLHADIASTACKELAHYMEQDHYLKFVGEMENYLQVLGQNDTPAS